MQPHTGWTLGVVGSGVLILRFLWAAFVPGGEWPMSPAHYMAMAFDAGLLIALIGMRPQISEAPQTASHPGFTRALLACGVVSGIGLLLIRFTSDQAWWTGHLRSSL